MIAFEYATVGECPLPGAYSTWHANSFVVDACGGYAGGWWGDGDWSRVTAQVTVFLIVGVVALAVGGARRSFDAGVFVFCVVLSALHLAAALGW